MGFIMEGIGAEGYDRSYSDGQLLRRIVRYFRAHWPVMAFVAVMIVLDAAMNAALPVLIGRGIDAIAGERSGELFARTTWVILAILLAGALAWTFNFFRQWFTARTVGSVVLELREDAFEAVMARDLSFYDEFPAGKIVSRVTSDTQAPKLRHRGDAHAQPDEPTAAAGHRLGDPLFDQRALGADRAGHRPLHRGGGAVVSLRRPHHHPAGAAGAGRGECQSPGDHYRHLSGQELPPGGDHLPRVFRREHPLLRPKSAPGDGVQRHLSDPRHHRRHRQRGGGLRRRRQRRAGRGDARRVVPVRRELSPCSGFH